MIYLTSIEQALDAVAIVTFVCNVARDTRDMMGFLWQIVCPTNDEADQVFLLRRAPPEWIAST